MTTLIIARHGNTFGPGDTVTYVGGRTDLPLVESGREQAKKIGAYLNSHKLIPDVVYASALKRAQETAAIAVKESRISNPVYTLDIFNEIDYGPDENKTKDEIVARIGEEALRKWDEEGVPPPGWNVDTRALIWNWENFSRQIREHDDNETILVVTSNGVARFAPYITGDYDAFRAAHAPKMATGALSIFGFDGAYRRWVLKHWNLRP